MIKHVEGLTFVPVPLCLTSKKIGDAKCVLPVNEIAPGRIRGEMFGGNKTGSMKPRYCRDGLYACRNQSVHLPDGWRTGIKPVPTVGGMLFVMIYGYNKLTPSWRMSYLVMCIQSASIHPRSVLGSGSAAT